MVKANINLDVSDPRQVSNILSIAADEYSESAMELESTWQDENAGKPWRIIAKILYETSLKCERALRKNGF